MKMAHITHCDAVECAFNTDEHCHALSITVGGQVDHKCDTFFVSSQKGGNPAAMGMVGACKVSSCMNNSMLECSAESICVGHCSDQIDCLSFAQ